MTKINIPEDMIVKYLARRKADLITFQKALNENNFDLLAHLGHQIKGSASSFGFEELGIIAIDLEKHALQKDTTCLILDLEKFKKFLVSFAKI